MKKRMRRIAAIGMVALLLGMLCGCSGKDYAIKVGDQRISENEYKRTVSALRQNTLYAAVEPDTKEFWLEEAETGVTRADQLAQTAQETLIRAALYAEEFDRLGLSFTAEEEAGITEAIQQVVAAYGSMTAFNEALSDGYYTYDEYVDEYYATAKKNKVLSHHFSAVTAEQIEEYYKENYVYVKFIYITKEDADTGKFLTGAALEEARSKAEAALEAANNAGKIDNFEDLIGLYSDVSLAEGEGVLVSDNGAFDATFTKEALALEVDEIKIIETEGAFMVTKRVDGMDEEIFTSGVKMQMLEEMNAEAIADLLEEWRAEAGVTLNKKVLKKYRADRMSN